MQPNTWGALDERGNAYRGRGNYDLAIADYNDAIRLYPSGAAIYFDRGQAHALKRDSGLAITDFNQALQMQPNVEAYLYARCMIRAAAAIELDKALADCNHALQINPGSAADIDARGFVHFKRGEFAQAINDTSQAVAARSEAGQRVLCARPGGVAQQPDRRGPGRYPRRARVSIRKSATTTPNGMCVPEP